MLIGARPLPCLARAACVAVAADSLLEATSYHVISAHSLDPSEGILL